MKSYLSMTAAERKKELAAQMALYEIERGMGYKLTLPPTGEENA